MKLQSNLQPTVLGEALRYADYGWYVLPLWSVNKIGECLCGNRECNSPGKHPYGRLAPNGLKDATIDKDIISSWFGRNHNLNVAVCTGEKSGIVVLDIDVQHGGSIEGLVAKYGKLPKTPYTKTGGGGYHFIFEYRDGVRNSAGTLGQGLDVRGKSGYVVAPPSLHASGRKYTWVVSHTLRPATCPDWMVRAKKNTPLSNLYPSHLDVSFNQDFAAKLQGAFIPVGERNDTLMRVAGGLRRMGLSAEQIYPLLEKMNQDSCKPPLEQDEIEGIAKSVANYKPFYKLLYYDPQTGDAHVWRANQR